MSPPSRVSWLFSGENQQLPVTAPGVWMPRRGGVYLSVTLFGHNLCTSPVRPDFPLILDERLRFEKLHNYEETHSRAYNIDLCTLYLIEPPNAPTITYETYYAALDSVDVERFLTDELLEVELLQVNEYDTYDIRLASFVTNARDFLYPIRSVWPSYSSGCRELLLSDTTVAFPRTGCIPKVEFRTTAVIREDLLGGAYDTYNTYKTYQPSELEIRGRSRSRSRTRSGSLTLPLGRSLSRSRSLSRGRSIYRARSPSPSPVVLRSCLRKSRYDTALEDAGITSSYVRPRSVSPLTYRSYVSRPLSPVVTSAYNRYSQPLYRSFDDMALTDRSYIYRPYTSPYTSYLY